MRSGNVTVSVGGGVSWYQMPKLDSLGLVRVSRPFGLLFFSQGPTALDSFQLNEPGGTVDGSVAVDLDIDGLSNPRAEIGISYTHLSADAFGSEVCTGLFSCDALFVDGTGAPNVTFAFFGNTFTTRVRGELDVLEIPLSLTTELASFGSGPQATVLTGSVGAATRASNSHTKL